MTAESPVAEQAAISIRTRLLSASCAVLAVVGAGCTRGGSTPNQPPRTTPTSSAPAPDYSLGPIEGKWLEELSTGISRASEAAEVDVDAAGNYTETASSLPPLYEAAFTHAINQPLVRLAAKKGKIKQFVVMPSRSDNGMFSPGDKSIAFDVSNGKGEPEDRIYTDARIFDFVADHEAMHSLSDGWYQVLSGEKKTSDHVLSQKVTAVTSACAAMRDSLYRDFIAEHRTEAAQAFLDASAKFTAMLQDKRAVAEQGASKLRRYSTYMALTAAAIRKDDPAIYKPLSDEGCSSVSFSSIPYAVPGIGTRLGVYTEYDKPALPIFKMNAKQQRMSSQAYDCIRDGNAEAAALGIKRRIPGGHAFDDPTETASSIVTVLIADPNYIGDCMRKLDTTRRGQLTAVIRTTLDITRYTNPDVLKLLSARSPAAAAVISEYS